MDKFDSASRGHPQPISVNSSGTAYFSKPKLLQHPKTETVSINDLPKTSNARDDSRSDPDISFAANFGRYDGDNQDRTGEKFKKRLKDYKNVSQQVKMLDSELASSQIGGNSQRAPIQQSRMEQHHTNNLYFQNEANFEKLRPQGTSLSRTPTDNLSELRDGPAGEVVSKEMTSQQKVNESNPKNELDDTKNSIRLAKVHPIPILETFVQCDSKEGTDDISANITKALNTEEDHLSPQRIDQLIDVTDFGINMVQPHRAENFEQLIDDQKISKMNRKQMLEADILNYETNCFEFSQNKQIVKKLISSSQKKMGTLMEEAMVAISSQGTKQPSQIHGEGGENDEALRLSGSQPNNFKAFNNRISDSSQSPLNQIKPIVTKQQKGDSSAIDIDISQKHKFVSLDQNFKDTEEFVDNEMRSSLLLKDEILQTNNINGDKLTRKMSHVLQPFQIDQGNGKNNEFTTAYQGTHNVQPPICPGVNPKRNLSKELKKLNTRTMRQVIGEADLELKKEVMRAQEGHQVTQKKGADQDINGHRASKSGVACNFGTDLQGYLDTYKLQQLNAGKPILQKHSSSGNAHRSSKGYSMSNDKLPRFRSSFGQKNSGVQSHEQQYRISGSNLVQIRKESLLASFDKTSLQGKQTNNGQDKVIFEERRDSFLPEGLISDPRFFLEQIRMNLMNEHDEKLANVDHKASNFVVKNNQKYQELNNNGKLNQKDSTTPQATDGIAGDDEDEIIMKSLSSKYWKKTVKLQIRALKLLMTTEYDKFMVLSSIVHIVSVIVYILTGPEYFELQGSSQMYSNIVLNTIQILMMLIQIFDSVNQAIAYKCDCLRQPNKLFWNFLILAIISVCILDILSTNSTIWDEIDKMQQSFFVLIVKILVGIHKIYLCQVSLRNKFYRELYLGSRICDNKTKHLQVQQDGNSSIELDENKFILGAIDDTLMTPQEKILKILNSMRKIVQGKDYLFYKDLGYCIKVVSSGELFNINLQEDTLVKSEFKIRQQVIKQTTNIRKNFNRRFTVNLAPNYEKKGFQDSIGWAQHYHKFKVQSKDFTSPKSGLNSRYSKINSQFNPDVLRVKSMTAEYSYEQSSQTSQKDFTPHSPQGLDLMSSQSITTQFVEQKMKCTKDVVMELERIHMFHFNIFNIQKSMPGQVLTTTVAYILAKEGIFEEIKLNKLKFFGFMGKISKMYKDLTYHNQTHAADLVQTFYHVTTVGHLAEKTDMDKFELMTFIVAAACHDVDHPGFNNVFLMETRHPIANFYNDQSVLENHHIATTFKVLSEQYGRYDIFDQFDREQYKQMRQIMIGAILATDMSEHFSKFGEFKGKVLATDFDATAVQNKKLIHEMLFHLCDISNAAKPFEICQKWTDLLFVEFFHQGDLEKQKNLSISMFMDRRTTNIASSQMGFIDFIIKPSFEVTALLLPNLYRFKEAVDNNRKQWEARVMDYDPKKVNKVLKRLSNKSDTHFTTQGAAKMGLYQIQERQVNAAIAVADFSESKKVTKSLRSSSSSSCSNQQNQTDRANISVKQLDNKQENNDNFS